MLAFLQMSPLGDRLLVKPEEEAQVRICLDFMSSSCINMCSHQSAVMQRAFLSASSAVEPFAAACLLLLCPRSKITAINVIFVQTTSGGLLLSSGTTKPIQEALIGEVLAVGEDVDIDVKVGSKVLFSKYSSSDVKSANGDVSFVAQKSILATLS